MHKAGTNLRRIVLASVGLLSLGIGIVGVWVPGLPTTVFLLIALWCFGQSSPRLQRRLYGIKWLQPFLAEADTFRTHRAVRLRSKITAQLFAWLMSGVTLLLTGPGPVWVLTVIAALSCTIFMVRIPTYIPRNDQQQIAGR